MCTSIGLLSSMLCPNDANQKIVNSLRIPIMFLVGFTDFSHLGRGLHGRVGQRVHHPGSQDGQDAGAGRRQHAQVHHILLRPLLRGQDHHGRHLQRDSLFSGAGTVCRANHGIGLSCTTDFGRYPTSYQLYNNHEIVKNIFRMDLAGRPRRLQRNHPRLWPNRLWKIVHHARGPRPHWHHS